MAISKELLDQLIADYKKPEDLIGENRQVEGDKQPRHNVAGQLIESLIQLS